MAQSANNDGIKRHERSYNRYRRGLSLLLWLLIMALAQATLLGYMNWSQPKPRYFASTKTGRLVPLHPLSEPVLTDHYLLQWASQVARLAYNVGFVHFNKDIDRAKVYFSPDAWQEFLKSIDSSGFKNIVVGRKLQASAVVSGAPVILNRAIIGGRFTWRVQMPVLVTFESANQRTQRRYIVTMDIQRVPVLIATQGIRVMDFQSS